jgi:outer membrane protein assembly factor BamD
MNMSFSAHWTGRTLVAAFAMVLLSSCIHKKYENPITKDTQQPDKKLFDKAMVDIEKGRYEVARLTLNTLMNTYESSEYLAKAKLAIADSWFREAGPNGMAQAEAEYKDFELFYPTMPEASEAQHKICMIHYKQMEKADRDPTQALRAEDECRQLLVQYPNSKYAPETSQLLRNIDEVLGSHEFGVGHFYFDKGANPAAANRLGYAADQYPLYSKADQALYETGMSYVNMGPRFRNQAATAFARIVRDYPLSDLAEDAKKQLQDMEMPIPEPDRAAYDRQKYDAENYKRPTILSQSTGFIRHGPDVSRSAKSGQPAMNNMQYPIPVSVPKSTTSDATATGAGGAASNDVSASVVSDSSKLDQGTDARQNAATGNTGNTATPGNAATQNTAAQTAAPPSNHDAEMKKARERAEKKARKHKKKSDQQNGENTSAQGTAATPAAQPPATGYKSQTSQQ